MNKNKKRIPAWAPIYVTGREGFSEKLTEALMQSGLPFMPGYYFESTAKTDHTVMWVDSSTPLKAYKQAIGARILWKYRIRFFTALSEFLQFACGTANPEEELEPAA